MLLFFFDKMDYELRETVILCGGQSGVLDQHDTNQQVCALEGALGDVDKLDSDIIWKL